MKRITLAAQLGITALALSAFLTQSDAANTPPFTLHLRANQDSYKSGEGVLVTVDKTNVSRSTMRLTLRGAPGSWFKMSVVSELGPAEETNELKQILHPSDPGLAGYVNNGTIAYVLKPGESMHQNVPLTMYFRMTRPGKYRVVFSEATDPGQPDNIEVKSNTIAIMVTE